MVDVIPYVVAVIFLMIIISGKILLQRFFNRSLRTKSIDPSEERKVQWQFVILMSICGLASSLIISLEVSPGVLEVICTTGVATIGFSIFAWVVFWMIDALVRARIKAEIRSEAKDVKTD
jgi:hypothetical protein